MRREQLFSAGGFYGFLVQSNVLLHREAVERGVEVLTRYLHGRADHRPIPVLDLACGGEPVSFAAMLARFPAYAFGYTGIDVNPDQVAAARRFAFPPNVQPARLVEGSAWDLRALPDGAFEVAFMGMNLHHGTPEEVRFLARGLARVLTPGGVFFDHDWFRPDDEPYVRRPDRDPDDPTESLRMVEPAALAPMEMGDLDLDEAPDGHDAPWRIAYVRGLHDTLRLRGADPAGARATAHHVARRDFPIATREFRRIFETEGFRVDVLAYDDSPEPLAPYTKMSVAWWPGR